MEACPTPFAPDPTAPKPAGDAASRSAMAGVRPSTFATIKALVITFLLMTISTIAFLMITMASSVVINALLLVVDLSQNTSMSLTALLTLSIALPLVIYMGRSLLKESWPWGETETSSNDLGLALLLHLTPLTNGDPDAITHHGSPQRHTIDLKPAHGPASIHIATCDTPTGLYLSIAIREGTLTSGQLRAALRAKHLHPRLLQTDINLEQIAPVWRQANNGQRYLLLEDILLKGSTHDGQEPIQHIQSGLLTTTLRPTEVALDEPDRTLTCALLAQAVCFAAGAQPRTAAAAPADTPILLSPISPSALPNPDSTTALSWTLRHTATTPIAPVTVTRLRSWAHFKMALFALTFPAATLFMLALAKKPSFGLGLGFILYTLPFSAMGFLLSAPSALPNPDSTTALSWTLRHTATTPI
ncbi:MAG: hypothetical protein AAFS10_25460, partial [Myxococcota bacterium]